MKTKTTNYILVTLFLILFSFLFGREYFQFHSELEKKQIQNLGQNNKKTSFSFEKVRKIENIDLVKTPDKTLIKTISDKINGAKNRVYVEAYILTETNLQKALVGASKKGIDVKVILEKNVYMAPNLNKKAYDYLEKAGVSVIWSDSKDYTLNHSKYFIIDDNLIISTGNFSYSLFTKNRDFILFIKDNLLLNSVLKNFLYDFSEEKNFIYDDNLVLSPNYSREKLELLLNSAKKSIKIYFPYFSDYKLMNILKEKQKSGVIVQIITDKKNETLQNLKDNGFECKVLEKLTEHAKSILIDDNILYIGSINFSESSMDRNREMGLILKEEKIIKKFIDFFSFDFINSSP